MGPLAEMSDLYGMFVDTAESGWVVHKSQRLFRRHRVRSLSHSDYRKWTKRGWRIDCNAIWFIYTACLPHGFILCDPTQPNPSHQVTDPFLPNPLQVEKLGPNSTPPNATNNGAYSLVVTCFYTQNLSVSGTCQIGRKIKFNCLVQPNLI